MAQTVETIRALAEAGDLKAMMQLVDLLCRERNLEEAMRLSEAVLEHPDASEDFRLRSHHNIGEIFSLKGNDEEALKHYQLARTSSYFGHDPVSSLTQLRIADILYRKKDPDCFPHYRAVWLYQPGSDQERGALLGLASCYMEGLGVGVDFAQAITLLERALSLCEDISKSAATHNNLGFAHEMMKEYDNAARYYKKANEMGSKFAPLNLALLHQRGLGVAQDFSLSREYYEKGKEARVDWQTSRDRIAHPIEEALESIK